MRGGLLNKAKRGELVRPLPIGYIYNEDGQIIKDRDAQVQASVTLFFNSLKRIGSAHGVISEFEKQDILFPSRKWAGTKLGELTWKKLRHSKAVSMVKNPIYAGIYTYGKTQVQHTVSGRKFKEVLKEQYHAWLSNSHQAYISEAQFEKNNLQLAQNTRPRPGGHGGAVREGAGLLQGIALCGICGKTMGVKYYGKKTNNPYRLQYECNYDKRNLGGAICQHVIGGNIDRTIEQLLIDTINPMATDAAISIQNEINSRKEEILNLYSQQMERARYEMELAKRRYLRVDPDNRLVAAELERDWNEKVREHGVAKAAYEQKSEEETRVVDEKLKIALEQLVTDFPKLWNDPNTSSKEKKRIVRLVLDNVTITADKSKIILGVCFKGGATRVIELPNTNRSLSWIRMEQDIIAEIQLLLPAGVPNDEIVDILNKKGFHRHDGKPFERASIVNFMKSHNIPTRLELAKSDGCENWLTLREKMAELGVSETALKRMRESGELVCKPYYFNKMTFLYKPEIPEKI